MTLSGTDRSRGARWVLAMGIAAACLAGLVGCSLPASSGLDADATASPTGVGEPDVRRRARIRLELAANYMQMGQTEVALDEVRKVVAEALEKACLRRESDALQREAERYRDSEGIVTQGPAMGRLLETARQIAPTDCNVLITGASGTRARNCWPKTSTATAPGGEARSSASTAVFSTNSCSPTSCSDMKRVPSPAPWPKATR